MVKAIQEGRKTQTRRAMKPQPKQNSHGLWMWSCRGNGGQLREEHFKEIIPQHCPYGKPGDRLWVRETWGRIHYEGIDEQPTYFYRADETDAERDALVKWRPSIHMPRAASRITLDVINVRVQRLQQIGEPDARAEGVGEGPQEGWVTGPVVAFADLWDSINGRDAWLINPWVWVVEFKVIKP